MQAHRYPLLNLDPVAGSVLRRQQGELGAGGRADAFDTRGPGKVRVGVDHHGGLLADLHIGEMNFLEVGFDPGVATGAQGEDRLPAWICSPASSTTLLK